MKTKLITAVSILLLISTAAAVEPRPNQAEANNQGITQGELKQQSFFNGLLSVLSFSGVQSTYEPGEQISLEINAQTETEYNTEDAVKVVEVYKCADSSCETPPPIDSSSEDQCSQEEWWPEYDDCVAKDNDRVSFSATQEVGTSWSWDAEFNGFEDESNYILVGYIWTQDQGIVTDVSKKQFQVESSTNGGTGGTGGTEVDVVSSKSQINVDVDVESETVSASVPLKNTGSSDMEDSNIVELQVVKSGRGPLSFVSRQKTCDPNYPENVAREYRLDAGDRKTVNLQSDISTLEKGENYDVFVITRSKCYFTEPVGNEPVEPFGNGVNVGSFTYEDGGTVNPPGPGIPVIPVVVGLLIVAVGGVYWKYG